MMGFKAGDTIKILDIKWVVIKVEDNIIHLKSIGKKQDYIEMDSRRLTYLPNKIIGKTEFRKELTEEEEQELVDLGLTTQQAIWIRKLAGRGGNLEQLRKLVPNADLKTLFEVANIVELYKIN